MQPADLATIRDALATVRELSVYDRECTDAEWASINIASRLLARELVRTTAPGAVILETSGKHYPGEHRVQAQLNGRLHDLGAFRLLRD